MKFKKYFISFLIIFSFLGTLVTIPIQGKEGDKTVLIAGSDYQGSNDAASSSQVTRILQAMQQNGIQNPDGLLWPGDYNLQMGVSTEVSNQSILSLKNTVSAVYPSISLDNMVLSEGNHESADNINCNRTGAYEFDDYTVYVINEDEFPWESTNNVLYKDTVIETANGLKDYLNSRIKEGYTKPIFVLCHVPLHITNRTGKGSGYAKYLFNVLNKGGAAGLNIFFLYGHVHSSGAESYHGGAAVYYNKGDTIYIPSEGYLDYSISREDTYEARKLSFTYLNAGYTGYYHSNGVDSCLTMTSYAIDETSVEINRYNKDGLHDLKSAGKSENSTPSESLPNVIPTGQVVKLATVKKDMLIDNYSDNLELDGTWPEDLDFSVNGVKLNRTELTLDENETYQLEATVTPETARNKNVNWSSDNNEIITVNENGLIQAKTNLKKSGIATITVTTEDGNYTASCKVNVVAEVDKVHVTNISSPASMDMLIDETKSFDVTITPKNATNPTCIYESDDPTIASIDEEGNITANKLGTTIIRATSKDGNFKTATTINVLPRRVESFELVEHEKVMITGNTGSIPSIVLPKNATDQSIHWSSSNPSIASIDEDGLITAVNVGKVTITATTHDGSFTDTCELEVKPVTVKSISFDKELISLILGQKETLTVSFNPIDASNQNVTWTSSNEEVATVTNGEITSVSEGQATITAVSEDGGRVASCDVYVSKTKVEPTDIIIGFEELIIPMNQPYELRASFVPVNTTEKEIKWLCYWQANQEKLKDGIFVGTGTTYDNPTTLYAEGKGGLKVETGVIVTSESSEKWFIKDGSLNIIDGNLSLNSWSKYSAKVTSAIIPDSVTSINDCFSKCSNMTEITIPYTVTQIASNAFSGCTSLQTVYVHEDSAADKYAFKNVNKVIEEHIDEDFDRVCDICEKDLDCDHEWDEGFVQIEPTCSTKGIKVITCFKCDKRKSIEIDDLNPLNHTGNIVFKNDIEATCSQAGYTGDTYCEDCGALLVKGREISKLAHSWNNGEITVQPTCVSKGTKTYTCTKCNETKDEEIKIDPSNHTGNTTIKNKVEATCSHVGYTGDTYCKDCNVLLVKGKEISKLAHSWNNGEITVQPTCVSKGTKTYTCTKCNETKDEEVAIDPSNHTGNTTIKNKVEATCSQVGYTGDTYCRDCNVLLENGSTLPMTDHSWDDGAVTKEATCTSTGIRTLTCKNCSATKTEVIPMTDHTPVIDPYINPTCITIGKTEGSHCAVCNTVLVAQQDIPTVNHLFTYYEDYEAATCTHNASKIAYCDYGCGTTDITYIENTMLEHVFNEWHGIAQANGCKQRECIDCGYVEYSDDHSWNLDYTIDKEATCTEDGERSIHCAYCDSKKNQETIPALGHTGGVATCHTLAVCERCFSEYGNVDVNNHTEIIDVNQKDPTCTEPGYSGDTICLDCNAVISEGSMIDALGHTGGKATCISKAICDRCQNEYGSVNENNHGTTSIQNEKLATTEADGYTGDVICDDCKAILEKGVVILKPSRMELEYEEVLFEEEKLEPSVVVYNSKDEVISASEYEVSYKNNNMAGYALVTVTFNGTKYSGTMSKEFKIVDSYLAGCSLSLNKEIGIHFYMYISSNTNLDDVVTFYMNDKEPLSVKVGDATLQEKDGIVYHVFTYNILAKEMRDTIQAVYNGKTYNFTVEQYANEIINHPLAYSSRDVDIANKMLNYGYYVQKYFQYHLDQLEEREVSLNLTDLKQYEKKGQDTNTIKFIGARLELKSTPNLKLYILGDGSFTVDGNKVSTTKEGQYTIITIENVIDIYHMYVIKNGNFTAEYSVASYGYRAYLANNEDLVLLVQSMKDYYDLFK